MGDYEQLRIEGIEQPSVTQIQDSFCFPKKYQSRIINLWHSTKPRSFPPNKVRNTKYSILSFIPLFLFNQFSQALNIFFLVIALSQLYPPLQVGFFITYVGPLLFVLAISLTKELYDDLRRWKRDQEVNSQIVMKYTQQGAEQVMSSQLKVGDVIEIAAHERIPADLVILATSEPDGTVFIKTDQLDGETDWKLRRAVNISNDAYHQSIEDFRRFQMQIYCDRPTQEIYRFMGLYKTQYGEQFGLSIENTAWASTVVATGALVGVVAYTGAETRSVLNSSIPSDKRGVTDRELNNHALYLILLMAFASFFIISLAGFYTNSFIVYIRCILLLSTVIPISLRVNLDMAKCVYAFWFMANDTKMPDSIPRNSNIPEELGRVHYLLTDKTGTLTKNEMVLMKLGLPHVEYNLEYSPDARKLSERIRDSLMYPPCESFGAEIRPAEAYVRDAMACLSVCHMVTPFEEEGSITFKASSPDEIALVQFAQSQGMVLANRSYFNNQEQITINTLHGQPEVYSILESIPFSSETKRMGVLARHNASGRIIYFVKGGDSKIVQMIKQHPNPQHNQIVRVKELVDGMANIGLRTLVMAYKVLTESQLAQIQAELQNARQSMQNSSDMIERVYQNIEVDLEFLCVTGVLDKLQDEADRVVESLRQAGIKIWMLTGDKYETAVCIGRSIQLIRPHDQVITIDNPDMISQYQYQPIVNSVIIIEGQYLDHALTLQNNQFLKMAQNAEAVICCRVSPTQKTAVTVALKQFTKISVCTIGDGGNDVGMIQAADVGIGIEGHEGKQASLAADFSITKFSHLARLLLWHGRLSYKRTAKLASFVIHRGLIIAVMQFIFICLYYYLALPLYNGWLMLGYTTIYTMLPVFSIIFDQDIDDESVTKFPELYKTLKKGRELNYTRFLTWIGTGIYQGAVIILLTLILYPDDSFLHIVSITFSALILTELLNIIIQTERFHIVMLISIILSLVCYIISIYCLQNYFDLQYVFTGWYLLRVFLITLASWGPVSIGIFLKHKLYPEEHQKINQTMF